MTRARRTFALVLGLVALALVASALLRAPAVPRERARSADAVTLLGAGATAGFERALAVRTFRFPEDHGPHLGFRNEWWYVTGHLRAAGGARYGYQLTLFRSALAPQVTSSTSAWRSRDVYLAHLAVTEIDAGRFRAYEHFERDALGLAGATTDPPAVWSGPVRLEFDPAASVWRITATKGSVGLALVLDPGKATVLQGEQGLSRKSATPGNASYYYAQTRLQTRGTLHIDGRPFAVTGASWLDREWSTSALEAAHIGWDWFALQLDDGRELMLYRLRRRDGQLDPYSAGTLVARDGRSRSLRADEFAIAVRDQWRSARTGVVYPARWRISVPAAQLDVEVRPALADQELRLALRYYEGAADVRDRQGRSVGRAYVELVGYGAQRGE